MVKMLIVEDEEILRNGIYRTGDWNNRDVVVIGLAKNGKEALALMEEELPDIILTDVVMPVMDGITLVKTIRERYQGIKVIILSGHEEFEYAKCAIEYNASNYLLKPATIEKVVEEVLKVKKEIEAEREKQEEQQDIRQRLVESIPTLRTHFLNQFITQEVTDPDEIEKQFRFLSIPLELSNLLVMALEMDVQKGERQDLRLGGGEEKDKIIRVCEDVMQAEYRSCAFGNGSGKVIVLFNYPVHMQTKDMIKYVEGKAVRIQKELLSRYTISVSIGIGRPAKNRSTISKTYIGALTALAYKFFMGAGSMIYLGDIESPDVDVVQNLGEVESEILLCLRSGDEGRLSELFASYFEPFAKTGGTRPESVYEEVTLLAIHMLRILRSMEYQQAAADVMDTEQILEELKMRRLTTLDEIRLRMEGMAKQVVGHVNADRILRSQGMVVKAKEYIGTHLDRDVSLITVADAVFVSPNYLSFLFKESGEKFKDYVIRAKMEKATSLLQEGKCSLSQIAATVGYSDGRYFSQVYRKYTGKSLDVKE